MAAASRSLATALWGARFASGLLQPSYTTNRDTTVVSRPCEGPGSGLQIVGSGAQDDVNRLWARDLNLRGRLLRSLGHNG